MKTVLRQVCFSISFLFFSSIAYATDYYVDKNASGSNNGTSWANAWQSIGSIVESSLEPGDVVYISGGTDSKIYYESVTLTDIVGTAANFITIRNSYESGHNGRVIIDGNNYTLSNAGLELQNCHYVYVKGIEIRRFNGGNDPGSLTASDGCNVVTFDSMLVYDNYGRHVRFSGTDALPTDGCTTSCVDSITIKNSYIVTSRWGLGQTDCIYAMGAKNIFIDNNYIRMAMNWNWSNSQHSDPIQAYLTRGWTITNNYIIADQNTFANSIILGAAGAADSVIIYNNFIIGTGTPTRTGITDLTVLYMREYGGGYPPTVVLHNTVISYGPNYYNTRQEYPINYAANNVFAQYGGGEGEYHAMITNSTGSQVIPVNSFDTNLYYREWAAPNWTGNWTGNGNTGSISGWTSWTSTYGGNGVNDNPDLQYDFSNYDTTDLVNFTIEDWRNGVTPTITGVVTSNSPARNQGLNLQSVVEAMGLEWKDINGNPRDASPTMGAYEFTTGGGGNNPPLSPSNPNPANASTNQPISLTISWTCSDPDGDPLTYNVYFGTNSNPPLASSNQSNTSFNPGQLENGTTYYWKIVANDNQGASSSGPVWNFTTEPGAGGDTTPPELVAIQIVDPDEIVIDFSEPIDSTLINNTQNYNISNNITVSSVELNETQQRLCLTTSNHDSNFVYSIEINGIKDTAGNLISQQANSAFYKLLDIGQINYVKYLMANVEASATTDTNTSPQKTLDGLVNGDPDPNSRWAAEIMPQWIQYDLGAVKEISLIASSFYNWNMGRTYQYSIQISHDGSQWDEIVTNQTSSNQAWTMNEIQAITYARYIRIICLSSNNANWAGVWETRIFGPSQVPVELISFTAEVTHENNVELHWSTASETNNLRFDVERKTVGENFHTIGSVAGHGTTLEIHRYSFIDNSLEEGQFTYRLKQYDFSGQFSFSNEVDIVVSQPLTFKLEQNYPNPFNPGTTISWQSPVSSWQALKVYDVLGNEVATLVDEYREAGKYEIEFNAANLPSGIYFYKLQFENFAESRKMLLLK